MTSPRIIDAVSYASEQTGVAAKDIMGASRFAHIVAARRLAMGVAHEWGCNYAEIARGMGKDRTTVRYAVRQFKAR